MTSFVQKLEAASQANRSLLCVGLDPDPRRMRAGAVYAFNKAIVDATRDLVCAYKPNGAFYEAFGLRGVMALWRDRKVHSRDLPRSDHYRRRKAGRCA